jgi:hypothetical protein
MEEEAKALIIILQTLARRGGETNRRNLGLIPGEHAKDEPTSSTLRKIVDQYAKLDARDLGSYLASPLTGSFPDSTFIELEPSRYTKLGYSFLWCSWKLGVTTQCGFFYGMFRMGPRHAVEGETPSATQVPQFWGYRFETPSWRDTEHRFFHAQPTDSMSPARSKISCALPRATDVPTFPLAVDGACGLLLALVLTTLGRDKLDEIVADLQTNRPAMRNSFVTEGIRQASALVLKS